MNLSDLPAIGQPIDAGLFAGITTKPDGTPRKLNDEQVRRLREWKPLHQLAKEMGVTIGHASKVRRRYWHKRVSP